MNSLGIFCDVNLKKSNDLMDVFEQALSKTNNLMETMENFNSYKIQNKNSINDEQEKNNNINSEIKGRKLARIKTFNQKKVNKFQLKPIKNNNKYYKVREPYNYQKEYEKDLINQIESLFNPNYKKGPKENAGMLSFISPLIDSNIINKNKDIYGSKERINKAKSNSNFKKVSFKRKSNEYNQFHRLRRTLGKNPSVMKRVNDYRQECFYIQAGPEDESDETALTDLAAKYDDILSDSSVREYLVAERRLCRMLKEIMDEIADTANLRIDL